MDKLRLAHELAMKLAVFADDNQNEIYINGEKCENFHYEIAYYISHDDDWGSWRIPLGEELEGVEVFGHPTCGYSCAYKMVLE